MTIDSTKDLLFLVLSIVIVWIGAFICWALYEIAKMLHQANELIADTRDRISRVESVIMNIKEKLGSSMNYLGMLAEGGKSVLSFLRSAQEKKEKRRAKKGKE